MVLALWVLEGKGEFQAKDRSQLVERPDGGVALADLNGFEGTEAYTRHIGQLFLRNAYYLPSFLNDLS